MAKYNGSVELISGLKQANNQDFPLVDASAVQVNDNGDRLDEVLNEKLNKSEIGNYSSASVSTTAPVSDNTQIWISPEDEDNFSVPEIKDDTVNATDTWSSKKIDQELSSLKSNIDSNTANIKNNKISVDTNLKISGNAADAKVTGDAIGSLKEDVNSIKEQMGSGSIGGSGESVPTFLRGLKYVAIGDSIVELQGTKANPKKFGDFNMLKDLQNRDISNVTVNGYVGAIENKYGLVADNQGKSGHTLIQDYANLISINYSKVALVTIGSYLSQFLCNLYLSQLYHNIGHYHKIRKHKNGTIENVRLVSHSLFYMDDILFLGTSLKNIQQAIKYIIRDAAEIGLKIKETWFTRKISWKDRKHETDFIDMMGIRIYRTHLTIRKRVFKRIRRVCIRLYRFWKLHQKIPIHLARKAISYYGLIKNTNSYKIKKKYHVNKIIQLSKGVIRNESTFYVRAAFC